jgi:membrane protein DedA with SNARE-associated domain
VADLLWPMITAFGLLVLAGIGFPIPEEIPVVAAGIWVAAQPELGVLRWLILPVCYAGIIISDVMLYGIGRLWGPRLLQHRWLARLMPADKRDQIEHNFNQYGVKILLFIRWVPAIRSPMFITAGIMRVSLIRFIVADACAAVLGHSLLFFLAYWFGDAFRDLVERAEGVVDRVKPILILALILAVVAYFLVHFLRRPVSTADPKEVPLIGPKVAATMDSIDMKAAKEQKRHEEKAT